MKIKPFNGGYYIEFTVLVDWHIRLAVQNFNLFSLRILARDHSTPWIIYLVAIDLFWYSVELAFWDEKRLDEIEDE